MKAESQFAERMAVVHSGNQQDAKDVRREELRAMFDVFLGPDFDPLRRAQVEKLQIRLFEQQAQLYSALREKEISREQYVDYFNDLLLKIFRDCEKILGPENFKQLFGTSPTKVGGFIDKEAFLEKAPPKTFQKSYAYGARKITARSAFMRPVQPDEKLSAIVGSKPLPRSVLTKKLWNYIKKNGLQDKKKKTQINADDALRRVFNGKSQVSLIEISKLISGHIR